MIQLNKYTIIFSDSFKSTLASFIVRHDHKKEAGGILLGQLSGTNIYLMQLSFPNSFDRASKYGFIRDKRAAQVVVDFAFANSQKKTIYLGEWHTHPESVPSPSPQDKRMLTSQFKSSVLNEEFLLLLIIGYSYFYIAMLSSDGVTEKQFELNELMV